MAMDDSARNARRQDEDEDPKWTPVVTAPDQLTAEMWQEAMLAESVPCMLAPQDTISFMGLAAFPVRLMVPLEMRARAREILAGLVEATPDTRPPKL